MSVYSRTKNHVFFGLSFVVACGLWNEARALSFDVTCGGRLVGQVDVAIGALGPAPGSRPAIAGGFSPMTPLTVSGAAALCDEDHFNWYQIFTITDIPFVNSEGGALKAPFVDLPPGGYGDSLASPGVDTQWADRLPWYFDEGKDPPAGTDGFKEGLNIADRTFPGVVQYGDSPAGRDGQSASFITWLVSLNKDGSFHSWHGGFEWEYSDPLDETGLPPRPPVIKNLKTHPDKPTKEQYENLIVGFDTRLADVTPPDGGGDVTQVPVPAGLALLVTALTAALGLRRRARRPPAA